jgi:hypothetical protein
MNDTTARKRNGGRIAAIVASGLIGLLSIGFLAAGGLLLWGDSKTDAQGYLSTRTDHFKTDTAALATDNLDIDLDGAESLLGDDLGKIRLKVRPNGGKPVFVGVARTSDVSDYLRGAPHDIVTDIDYSPFSADYSRRDGAGGRTLAAPGKQSIWAASIHGAGPQTLRWDLDSGNWSVVVMNADGSAGVDASISAGTRVGFLDEAGWISIGTGTLLLALAGGLLYLGVRPRRGSSLGTPDQATITVA